MLIRTDGVDADSVDAAAAGGAPTETGGVISGRDQRVSQVSVW